MEANKITEGTILKLNINNEIREYKVTLIIENEYKIFNKFTISQWVNLDFINNHLVS
jgi:hypothetical protein